MDAPALTPDTAGSLALRGWVDINRSRPGVASLGALGGGHLGLMYLSKHRP